jgi:hypothetical protein
MEGTVTAIQKQTHVNESKIKKLKPPSQKQYAKARVKEALKFCPDTRPCRDCGWPVIELCCCSYCGSTNP